MSNEEQLETIELTIEQAKEAVAMADALTALQNSKHFKKVISTGYFEKEATRLVFLKGDPSMQEEADQAQVLKAIDAVSLLRQHFITINILGRMAEKSIKDCEETREEILSEGE